MGENGITLGPGQVYLDGQPFAQAGAASIYTLDKSDEIEPTPDWMKTTPSTRTAELSGSLQLVGASAALASFAFFGVSKTLNRLCALINPRVTHLALHGRKARTRKKNEHRIRKILEKEAK